PWKHTLATYVDRHGVVQPLQQSNVGPGSFASITGQDPQLWQALLCCLLGLVLIALIQRMARGFTPKDR
ncbi:MAG: DUF368 domain-containing protein, partial [Rikenellaceae bacterium]|nr:DUF368 domain-containing protein [Rikenellaceae bacterium]